MSAALVPVKRLLESKSRLLPEFDAKTREALCLAMLRDLLKALAATPWLDRTAVVTPDPHVAEAACASGAQAILFEPPGLNPALDYAARALRLQEDEPLLVVLGDVAGAQPADLQQLFRALQELGGRGAVLAASSDGGTSALLRAPHTAIRARFGPDSAKRHRSEAERSGVPYRELHLASLALDLDSGADIQRFMAQPVAAAAAGGEGGGETRALLRALERPSQP